MLGVVMQGVDMLGVIMLNVVAPKIVLFLLLKKGKKIKEDNWWSILAEFWKKLILMDEIVMENGGAKTFYQPDTMTTTCIRWFSLLLNQTVFAVCFGYQWIHQLGTYSLVLSQSINMTLFQLAIWYCFSCSPLLQLGILLKSFLLLDFVQKSFHQLTTMSTN
jgi:hypothetical protein